MQVRAALQRYLDENGWTREQYDAPVTNATFFGIDVRVPNTPAHRRAIMRHDVHHVVTGYGTDLCGESEISAWELRRGLRGLDLYVSLIVVSGVLLGLVIAPLRTMRAWRLAGRGDNLFTDDRYDALLELDVETLRERLHVAREGVNDGERRLHARAPARIA